MAVVYRIEDRVGLVRQEKDGGGDGPYVEIYTLDGFMHVDLGDDDIEEAVQLLSHSHGTFVNMLPGCIIGSLSFPDKSDLLRAPSPYGFFLSPQRLIFIDSGDGCRNTLEGLIDLDRLPSITTSRILLLFMKQCIKDDAAFLTEQEKKLGDVEEQIIDHEGDITNHELLGYRRRLLVLDRFYQQLTDLTASISKDEHLLLTKDDRRLFRLFSQHLERLFQRAQYLKEYSLQLRELYQMQIDIAQNKTIQWLTVITTLVVPLTLLTSWYGMNFENMPELSWEYGYAVVIGISIVLVVVQLVFFKRRRWL